MATKFQFSNVVVVDDDLIGVIVKSWEPPFGKSEKGYSHDVYVRAYNSIRTYFEAEIKHFVYSKELAEDEHEFYKD